MSLCAAREAILANIMRSAVQADKQWAKQCSSPPEVEKAATQYISLHARVQPRLLPLLTKKSIR